jgi:hypothetical protein
MNDSKLKLAHKILLTILLQKLINYIDQFTKSERIKMWTRGG